jgi:signal peptidase I
MATSAEPAPIVQAWDPGPSLTPSVDVGQPLVRRLAGHLATAALVALVAAASLITVLMVAGIQPRTEATGSMEPVLSPGDLVFLQPAKAYEARVGDIAAFRDPAGTDRVIVHRVMKVEPIPGGRLAFTTKGDANSTGESWEIRSSGEMGLVMLHVPTAGRLLRPFQGLPWGVAPIVALLGIGVLLMRRIWSA